MTSLFTFIFALTCQFAIAETGEIDLETNLSVEQLYLDVANINTQVGDDGKVSLTEIENYAQYLNLSSPQEYRQQQAVCNVDVSDQQLIDLFGSLENFNCERFRVEQKEEQYCSCIDAVLKPENFENDQSVFRNAIYDTYFNLRVQKSNEGTLRQMEGVLPLAYVYGNQPNAEDENKSCFTENYNEAFVQNNQSDDTLKSMRDSENAIFNSMDNRYHDSGRIAESKQFDATFLNSVLNTFSNDLVGLQNKFLNMYSHNGDSTELSENITNGAKRRIWRRNQSHFNEFLTQNFIKLVIENKEKVLSIPEFNKSNFAQIKKLLTLENATEDDLYYAVRPITHSISAMLQEADFFDDRARSRDVNINDIQVTPEMVGESMQDGHILTPNQCRGFADRMRVTFLRNIYEGEQGRNKLISEFENEINDNNPATQARLMSQIEEQLLHSNAENFLSSIGFDQSAVNQSTWRTFYDNKEQALMTLKYTLGKMRCQLAKNEDGATSAEITAELRRLQERNPEVVDRSAALTSEYLQNRNIIAHQVELGNVANSDLVQAKLHLLAYANRFRDPDLENIDQFTLNQLKRDSSIADPVLDRLILEVENQYAIIADKDAVVRKVETRNAEIREELSGLIGARYANGLIANRSAPEFNEFAGIHSRYAELGMSRIDLQRVTNATLAIGSAAAIDGIPASLTRNPTITSPIMHLPRRPLAPIETMELPELVAKEIIVARLPEIHGPPDALSNSAMGAVFGAADAAIGVHHADSTDQARARHLETNEEALRESQEQFAYSESLTNHLAVVREVADLSDEEVYSNEKVNSSVDGYRRTRDFQHFESRLAMNRTEVNHQIERIRNSPAQSLAQMQRVVNREPIVRTAPNAVREREVAKTPDYQNLQERESSLRENVNRYVESQSPMIAPTRKLKTSPTSKAIPAEEPSETIADKKFENMVAKVREEIAEQRRTLEETKTELADQQREAEEEDEELIAQEIENKKKKAKKSKEVEENVATVDFGQGGSESGSGSINKGISQSAAAFSPSAQTSSVAPQDSSSASNVINGDIPITLPRRLSNSEMELIDRSPASTTEFSTPIELEFNEQIVLDLVQTPNELSTNSFIELQNTKLLPANIDPNKPLIVRRGNSHVIVKPVLEAGTIIRFEFLGEVEVKDVAQYVESEALEIGSEFQRMIRHDDLKDLIHTSSN